MDAVTAQAVSFALSSVLGYWDLVPVISRL
jgi:hypothetical protein